jgi:hypothetical protein
MGYFKKSFGAVKTFVRNSTERIKKGARILGPRMLNISQKGLGLLAHVPGTVGVVAGVANQGINTLRSIVKELPNESARNNLNNLINKGSDIVNKTAHNTIQTAKNLHDRAAGWAKFVHNVVDHTIT